MAFRIINGKLVRITSRTAASAEAEARDPRGERSRAAKRVSSTFGQSPRTTRTTRPTSTPTTITPQQVRRVVSPQRRVPVSGPAPAPTTGPLVQQGIVNEATRAARAGSLFSGGPQSTFGPPPAPFDLGAPLVSFTGAPGRQVAPLQTPVVSFTGANAQQAPAPAQQLSPLQQAIANLPPGQPSFGLQGAPAPIRTQEGAAAFGQGIQQRLDSAQLQAPSPSPVDATSANVNFDPNGGGGAAFPNAQNLFLAWRDPSTFDRPPIMFDEDFLAMNPDLRDAMAQIENVTITEFMLAMGYAPVPGTDKWIRLSLTTVPGTGSGTSGTGTRSFSQTVRSAARGGDTQPVPRGRTSMGLTNWSI